VSPKYSTVSKNSTIVDWLLLLIIVTGWFGFYLLIVLFNRSLSVSGNFLIDWLIGEKLSSSCRLCQKVHGIATNCDKASPQSRRCFWFLVLLSFCCHFVYTTVSVVGVFKESITKLEEQRCSNISCDVVSRQSSDTEGLFMLLLIFIIFLYSRLCLHQFWRRWSCSCWLLVSSHLSNASLVYTTLCAVQLHISVALGIIVVTL